MEEMQAITKLKQGNIIGLETLVRKYYLQAVRSAYFITQDTGLAEEVAQTCFVNLTNKIDQFDGSREFRPWFMRSVVNQAISVTRKRKRLVFISEEGLLDEWDNSLTNISENGHNLEDDYILEETSQVIWAALSKLNPQQRAAIVMRYYLGFSENEISEEMNRPKSTVKWSLYSAKNKLRQILSPLQSDRPMDNEEGEIK